MNPKQYKNLDEIAAVVHSPKRLKAVKESGLLGTAPEQSYDEITKEISRILKVPLVVLTLVNEYEDFVKSQVGLPEPMASAQSITDGPSFCQLTIAQAEPLAINDTRDVPMFRLFPSVQNSGVRAHLGVPLMIDGQPIGNCCAIDFSPREWSAEEIETLKRLAGKAAQLMYDAKKVAGAGL